MEYMLLTDDPSAYKQVAAWYFDEWLSGLPGMSVEKVALKLSSYDNRDKAPLLVLAKLNGELMGAAELKIREMDIYPEYEYWIGGVYVKSSARGKGIAANLVKEVIKQAKAQAIDQLYLQTLKLNGGLYSKLGFGFIEEVDYLGHHVAVMTANLNKTEY